MYVAVVRNCLQNLYSSVDQLLVVLAFFFFDFLATATRSPEAPCMPPGSRSWPAVLPTVSFKSSSTSLSIMTVWGLQVSSIKSTISQTSSTISITSLFDGFGNESAFSFIAFDSQSAPATGGGVVDTIRLLPVVFDLV